MAILRIKLVSADGQPMSGQSVKVSDCDTLQTNAEGMAQFLLGAGVDLDIEVNAAVIWTGSRAQLSRDEVFTATASGFERTSGG